MRKASVDGTMCVLRGLLGLLQQVQADAGRMQVSMSGHRSRRERGMSAVSSGASRAWNWRRRLSPTDNAFVSLATGGLCLGMRGVG